jgi:predicted O-linked N-acetylglucosamine transferase (SPINDLY family)
MDYVLADRYTLPPEAEPYCTERVLRMPDSYLCFEPPRDVPPVGPLPAFGRGGVTFGSFNNPAKLHRQVIERWTRILQRVPGARLVLKYPGLDDPGTRRQLAARFADSGLEAERVEIRGPTPYPACLAAYGEIDIALDPFPHTGGLTTCDALWMGVPVITCPGEMFAGRQSLSYLSTLGLTETIARDFDHYVELAVSLAHDLPRLAAIRAGLRERTARSALCDGPRAAENLAQLLRDVWRRWCAQQAGTGP